MGKATTSSADRMDAIRSSGRVPRVATAITFCVCVVLVALWAHRWYLRREAIASLSSAASAAHALGDDEGVRAALAGLRDLDLRTAAAMSLAHGFDGDSDTSRLAGSILVEAAGKSYSRRSLIEEADREMTNLRARIWIVIALGSIAHESDGALERLHEAIEDPDRNLVLAAIEELREAADPRSLHVLRGRLERCTHRDQIYWNLESAIRKIERESAFSPPRAPPSG